MAATIKKCECECVQQTDPCQSCQTASVEVQCRQRSGVAILCGYSEFTSPSSPPKKYRSMNLSGSTYGTEWSSPACSGTAVVHTAAYSGTNRYDKNSCIKSCGGTCVGSVGTVNCVEDFAPALNAAAWPYLLKSEITKVSQTACFADYFGNTGACVGGFPNPSNGQIEVPCDKVRLDLSEEDTAKDAMDRANPAWSAWGSSVLTCCAGLQNRGPDDFDFSFADAEYRVRVTGAPGAIVYVEFDFYRRIYGSSGGYAHLYSETRQYVVPSGGPNPSTSDWIEYEMPNDWGWETCLQTWRIVDAPS